MKQTARARIEQAVEKAVDFARGNRDSLPIGEVQFIMSCAILAERRRIRRGVMKLRDAGKKRTAYQTNREARCAVISAYTLACDDILARWGK